MKPITRAEGRPQSPHHQSLPLHLKYMYWGVGWSMHLSPPHRWSWAAPARVPGDRSRRCLVGAWEAGTHPPPPPGPLYSWRSLVRWQGDYTSGLRPGASPGTMADCRAASAGQGGPGEGSVIRPRAGWQILKRGNVSGAMWRGFTCYYSSCSPAWS